jgi:FixJ family two-component response regulator
MIPASAASTCTEEHYLPKVFVVDDDTSVREGLTNFLQSSGFSVVSFSSPQQFMSAMDASGHGCLVLDVRFPGESGLDLQDFLRRQSIPMPIILISGDADVPSSVRGMKAGGVDFLTKPIDESSLLDAINTAFQRNADRLQAEQQSAGPRRRYSSLTKREREVLEFITRGLMNKQVAHELGLSEVTVKVHRATMMRKLNVRTLADLARLTETLRASGSDVSN